MFACSPPRGDARRLARLTRGDTRPAVAEDDGLDGVRRCARAKPCCGMERACEKGNTTPGYQNGASTQGQGRQATQLATGVLVVVSRVIDRERCAACIERTRATPANTIGRQKKEQQCELRETNPRAGNPDSSRHAPTAHPLNFLQQPPPALELAGPHCDAWPIPTWRKRGGGARAQIRERCHSARHAQPDSWRETLGDCEQDQA